jgi:hypothetical protein
MSLVIQALQFLICAGDKGEVDRVSEGSLKVRVIHSNPSVNNNHFFIPVTRVFFYEAKMSAFVHRVGFFVSS